jgi:NAD(P)H-nitrite reductase large subunit
LIYDYVIVGAGIAGLSAASAIAAHDPGATIALVNGEDRAPYKRTKISKNIYDGFEYDAFLLNKPGWYEARRITVFTGNIVATIDLRRQQVTLSDSKALSWKKLILTAGAGPERIGDCGEEEDCFTVRHIRDVEALRKRALKADTSLVLGMGVLGVEVSEQLSKMGLAVTLAGNGSRLMERQLNEHASDHLQRCLIDSGIKLDYGRPAGPSPQGADIVVQCIGSNPDVRLAKDSGILTKRGVVVNDYLETSVSNVYAAGDIAEHEDSAICHLWHEAEHQGTYAGINAAGKRTACPRVPFRLKCEVFGHYYFSINLGAAYCSNLAKVEKNDPYRCYYLEEGVLNAIVMIDDPKNAKLYETAVRERWNVKDFEQQSL